MAAYRPTKADDYAFYVWAMQRINGPSFPVPEPNAVKVDLAFYIWALKTIHGDHCHICGMTPQERKQRWPNMRDWLREHKNNNPADFTPENLQLGCPICNQLKRPDLQQGAATVGNTERESKNASEGVQADTNMTESATERLRKKRQLNRASVEIQISKRAEPLVRQYIWTHVSREGGLLLNDAINESAEFADCDTQTATRKIGKATSRAGPFEVVQDQHGNDFIKLRKGYKPNPATAIGNLDIQIMLRLKQAAEEKTEQVKEQMGGELLTVKAGLKEMEDENKSMVQTLKRVGQARDIAIEKLMEITGLSKNEVEKMLDSKLADRNNGGQQPAPAAPVVKSGGDEPPAAGAAQVKKREQIPGIA